MSGEIHEDAGGDVDRKREADGVGRKDRCAVSDFFLKKISR